MTYTRIAPTTTQLPLEPAVLSIQLAALAAGTATDTPVYIPWKNCKLAYAYTVTTTAEGDKGAVTCKLELNAASGTEIGTITIAKNAAVGDIDEIVFATESAGEDLHFDVSDRDAINIETDGVATTTWQGTLFMYFVPNYKA